MSHKPGDPNYDDLVARKYYDRGDPAAFDFTVDSFTTDGTWRDLDLSAIVPSGAVLVLLFVQVTDDAVNSWISFRANGNANTINAPSLRTQVANQINEAQIIVPLDAGRVIEYCGKNLAFAAINVVVCGWWL